MSKYTELSSYIASLQQRLRLSAWLRGAAIFTGTALTVTVMLVLVLNHLAFPTHGVAIARLAILVALAAAAIAGIALPVTALTRARAVDRAETANPELEQRLTTFEERSSKGDDPFLELLAADTLAHTENVAPATLVPDNQLFALGGAGLACLGVLAWMIAAGPGFLGYGASLIWTGAKKDAAPLYSISVTPGNVTVRRNSDQLITAHVTGMQPGKAQLFARYQSALGWEPVLMQAAPNSGAGASYQFVLAGLPENVEYYVAAGPLVSQHYKVRVVDLPTVKEIKVTLHYPKWTGMKPVVEEHSGDLRAIEGTDAAIEVQMDRPLKDGTLTLDDGQTIHLTGGEGNNYQGNIHMTKDGAYHVAATDEGQPVRLSEDYFIATDKAQPPQISISRPTGDYRASPIEEVTVGVKGADEFGLTDMHLHYSINGGPDKDVSLLKTPGAKEADGSFMLPLEDYKLVPGDLVSVYATAKDGNSQAQTDISFIQVDPFEREFSQSQQSGGGGGGGGGGGQSGDQTEISKREKELIAATWKQQNDKTATPKDAAAQGQFLSDAQQKLRDQVNALSIRMQSRDVSGATEEFSDFDKDMQAASQAMGPSVDKLKATQWKDAMPLEQKALQALLRAEATFRQIEVAFGQQGGGGGGGGGNAGRDLASLFDLELDTAKNQYETAQTASPEEQHEKEVQDALDKLDALAKRQQDLANQAHDPQQSFQERWQQEMLRREAEQLQRQMEQLTRNGQQQNQQDQQNQQSASNSQQQNSQQQSSQNNPGGQSSAQGQSGSSGGSSSGQGGGQQSGMSAQSSSSGQNGMQSSQNGSKGQASQSSASGKSPQQQSSEQESSQQRIQEALNRLQQATDAMKRGGGSPQQETDAARQAADRLREATNLMAGTQQQLATGQVDQMAREAGRLTQEEHKQAGEIDQLAKAGQAASAKQGATSASDMNNLESLLKQRDQIAGERQQLSDDLSKLQKGMRDAARELAPDQPGVANKLRDSLSDMDSSELDNQVQRTADWLRSGINPNSNGTEAGIAQGLSKLSQQLQGAQQEAQKEGGQGNGLGKPGQERGAGQGDETAALDQVERLRSQLDAMARSRNGNGQPGQNGQNQNGPNGQNQFGQNQNGQNGQARNGQFQSGQNQNGRNGQNPYGPNGQRFNPQTGMLSRSGNGQQQGQNGQQQNGQNQGGQNGQYGQQQGRQNGQGGSQQGGQNQAGQQGGQQGGGGNRGGQQQAGNGARNGGNGNRNGGNQNGGYSGDTRAGGGGYRDGTVWGNYDTGGNTPTARGNRQPAPNDASGNPADTERTFDQSMRELNQLKQMVQDDPQAAKEVSDLTQKMQHLDPSRFPGNPAMVEQMHNEVLSSVDKLELELQRQGAATDARTGKPNPIPAGYQESVADYYRRLSKTQ